MLVINGSPLKKSTTSERGLTFFKAFIIIHYKTINLDTITIENNKEYNEKWPFITDHPDQILIIGGSGSGKANALFNLTKE